VLAADDRRTLAGLARDTVAAACRGESLPVLRNPSGALREKGAAFISLRSRDGLRGCIGHVRAVAPLWESVRDMAEAAATRDSRFDPVRPDELEGLEIEISVLSPLFPIDADAVEVGVHGLHLELGSRAGLLLPQVPVEWGWDRVEFLRRLHEKAGIPWGAGGTRLQAFTVERFGAP
jgi:AmmeMemoRadiSam system protein A